jgi:hypothetical protein
MSFIATAFCLIVPIRVGQHKKQQMKAKVNQNEMGGTRRWAAISIFASVAFSAAYVLSQVVAPQPARPTPASTRQTSKAGQLASAKASGIVTSTNQSATQDDTSKIASVVKIAILSSRGTVSRDGSYGVYADMQNVSPDPILLRANETVLVVQPEVAHPKACVDWAPAIFATQTPSTATPKATSTAEIRILPNEHYPVFWDLGPRPPQTNGLCQWDSKADYLGFVPGDYAFTVAGIAHVIPTNAGVAPTDHTFTETTTLKVGLSLLVTAIAAAFGGLLAYFVIFLQPGQDFERWKTDGSTLGKAATIAVWLRNALSACLLAASVTIVASRLSDTQFPIKVSVNDFWGAMTIGFVSYFGGSKFISNLASRWVTSTQGAKTQAISTGAQPPSTPTASAVPSGLAQPKSTEGRPSDEPPAPSPAPAD